MTRPALAAPAVSRNARRVTCVGVLMSRLLGRAVDGGADPLVSAAAADVRHRGVDVRVRRVGVRREQRGRCHELARLAIAALRYDLRDPRFLNAMAPVRDRKSTRLNSSHTVISYAVFCLKKKKTILM